MRAYQVTAKEGDQVLGTRFAATQALARDTRDELVAQFEVKKSAVDIEEVEIPMAKPDLLVFINELSAKSDAVEEGDE
jgi:hypothetical protein